ncbi:hypothetical protein ACET9B_18985 [Aeromonas veronii]
MLVSNNITKLLVKKTTILVYIAFAFLIFSVCKSLATAPMINGDGHEYYLMSESFFNHGSANLLEEDIQTAKAKSEKYEFVIPYINDQSISGYYESIYDELYSYHFFAYVIATLPFKYIAQLFGLNDLYGFYLANIFIYFTSLLVMAFSKNSFKFNLSLMLFAIFGPGYFYITWTHPEVYTYGLVFSAIALYFSNSKKWFYFLFAVASFQNPPVILFSSCFLIYDIVNWFRAGRHKDIIYSVFLTGLSLIPSVFYFYNYGVPNLIAREGYSELANISINRVVGLIFSPVHGLILYNPLLSVLFFVALVCVLFKRNNVFFSFLMAIGIFLTISASATTHNWNSGMTNVIRYAVWVYPLLCMFVAVVFKKYILEVSLVNCFAFLLSALFIVNNGYVHFNSLSTSIITHAPRFMITDYESFCENTYHQDGYLQFKGRDALPCLAEDKSGNVRIIYTDYNSMARFSDKDFEFNSELLLPFVRDALTSNEASFVYLPKGLLFRKSLSWDVSELPTIVGRVNEHGYLNSQNVEGFLSYGPYVRLPSGSYQAVIEYSCEGEGDCGAWDIILSNSVVLDSGSLSSQSTGIIKRNFKVGSAQENEPIEIRTQYLNSSTDLVLKKIKIEILR